MTDLALRVEGLSKRYRIGKSRGLRDLFQRSNVSTSELSKAESLWALKDVSFDVRRGEVVGIIGRNGAGKSTLLKILSRITEPTSGRAILNGRVGSLLEVGTGFHPELTGRENIYLNGAILGMKKREIDRKLDEIVAFAEIEKFLDTPVKRYSSGMYVRLAFAVAAHLEPEVLLVDEVLAVGDAAFQKKCLGKMGDVAREGRTVLFVSHNLSAVRNLCSTSILIESGGIAMSGASREVVLHYMANVSKRTPDIAKEGNTRGLNQSAYFLSWSVIPPVGDQHHSAVSGSDFVVNLEVELKRSLRGAFLGIALWSDDGTLIWAANSHDSGKGTVSLEAGRYNIQFGIKNGVLMPGQYWIEASINCIDGQLDRWQAYPGLEVLPSRPTLLPVSWYGLVDFDYSFHIYPVGPNQGTS